MTRKNSVERKLIVEASRIEDIGCDFKDSTVIVFRVYPVDHTMEVELILKNGAHEDIVLLSPETNFIFLAGITVDEAAEQLASNANLLIDRERRLTIECALKQQINEEEQEKMRPFWWVSSATLNHEVYERYFALDSDWDENITDIDEIDFD